MSYDKLAALRVSLRKDTPWCVEDNGVFICTLPRGHAGDHVARGTWNEELDRWRDAEELHASAPWNDTSD